MQSHIRLRMPIPLNKSVVGGPLNDTSMSGFELVTCWVGRIFWVSRWASVLEGLNFFFFFFFFFLRDFIFKKTLFEALTAFGPEGGQLKPAM